MFYKFINKDSKEVQVYFGDDEKFAEENGFVHKGDVEQVYHSGSYYPLGEVPEDVLKKEKRFHREAIFDEIKWKIDRYREEQDLGIKTTDSEEEYRSYLEYRQYLRDLPQMQGFPNINIKTYEQYKEIK